VGSARGGFHSGNDTGHARADNDDVRRYDSHLSSVHVRGDMCNRRSATCAGGGLQICSLTVGSA